jgi:hypothetical protein
VALAVEDDGVDFTPEERERIFDQELALDGARAGRSLSHGVAMARQLAHANGGELRTVEPEAAGGRARFELSLPLALEEAPEGRHAESSSPAGSHGPAEGAEGSDPARPRERAENRDLEGSGAEDPGPGRRRVSTEPRDSALQEFSSPR